MTDVDPRMPPAGEDDAFANRIVGILLAAGRGTRFDPSGTRSKLMQPLPGGDLVAVAAARNLLAVLPGVLAVVRVGDPLGPVLAGLGCRVVECRMADRGLSASLAEGLTAAREASGWIVALADMPRVAPDTIARLAVALQAGAGTAAPFWQGQRGNPVGFGRRHLPALLGLKGDRGARDLLKAFPPIEITVDDPGVCLDIDLPSDLAACGRSRPGDAGCPRR